MQDTQVKHGVKRDEQERFEELAKEAEQSMQQGNIKAVYSPQRKYATNRPRRWMQLRIRVARCCLQRVKCNAGGRNISVQILNTQQKFQRKTFWRS